MTWTSEPTVTCRRCGVPLGFAAALGHKPRTCTTPFTAARTEAEAHDLQHQFYTIALDSCLARMIERDTQTLLELRAPTC